MRTLCETLRYLKAPEFKASISQSQYFSNFLVESESFQLACQFVKKTKDTKSLEELENLIQERIKKLS